MTVHSLIVDLLFHVTFFPGDFRRDSSLAFSKDGAGTRWWARTATVQCQCLARVLKSRPADHGRIRAAAACDSQRLFEHAGSHNRERSKVRAHGKHQRPARSPERSRRFVGAAEDISGFRQVHRSIRSTGADAAGLPPKSVATSRRSSPSPRTSGSTIPPMSPSIVHRDHRPGVDRRSPGASQASSKAISRTSSSVSRIGLFVQRHIASEASRVAAAKSRRKTSMFVFSAQSEFDGNFFLKGLVVVELYVTNDRLPFFRCILPPISAAISINTGGSRIRATRPSPRMLAPAMPATLQ